jgi:hypothetical protein
MSLARPRRVVADDNMPYLVFIPFAPKRRPAIPAELRQQIRRMGAENPLWGEERIANELRLKLGLRLSPRTVAKYLPKHALGRPRGDQRWSTFLRNHARAIVACDFFVAVSESCQEEQRTIPGQSSSSRPCHR